MAFSVLIVVSWIYKTYSPHFNDDATSAVPGLMLVDVTACAFFTLTYFREHLRDDFRYPVYKYKA